MINRLLFYYDLQFHALLNLKERKRHVISSNYSC